MSVYRFPGGSERSFAMVKHIGKLTGVAEAAVMRLRKIPHEPNST